MNKYLLLLLLVGSISMIQACKKAEKEEVPPVVVAENIVTEKDTYKLYEIGTVIYKHNLQPNSKIEGKVGSSSLQIGVANDSTLVFVVLPNVFQIGENKITFSINGKNVNVSVKVTSTNLVPSPVEEINSFTANQQTQITSLETIIAKDPQLLNNPDLTNAVNTAKSLTTDFKADFDKLNTQDQLIVANFIASNKPTFEKINTDINSILSALSSSNNGLLRRSAFCTEGTPVEKYKCHWEFLGNRLKEVAFYGSLAYVAFSTMPVTGLFGLGVGAVPAALAAPSMVAVVAVSAKLIIIHFKIAFLLVAGVIKEGQLRTTNTPTIFENGVSTPLPVKIRLRNIQVQDNSTKLNWLKIGMVLVDNYNSFCDKLKLSKFKFLFGGLRTLDATPFKLSHISINNISNSKVLFAGLEGTAADPKFKFTTNETSEQLFNFDLTYNDGVNLPVTITIPSKLKTGGCNLNTFTDSRDGKVYKKVQIGTQEWMAENLNYATGNSWCYNDNSSNCTIYGRLYDWETAKKACPSGWHLPSDAEWTTLTNFLGGESVAGGKMMSTGTQYWNSPNTATNSSCFSGLPGGQRHFDGSMLSLREVGVWWSSTEYDTNLVWNRALYYNNGSVFRGYNLKAYGFSVRCLRD